MSTEQQNLDVEIFSTAPQSKHVESTKYIDLLADIAGWSEEAGYKGILLYTDNSLIDPWLVAQIILENSENLCPLVAVQPVYMHPYSIAKMIASFGYLYGRRTFLNMVAGGFRNDLLALNDDTSHDRRYDRLVEYTLIIKALLKGDSPVKFEGEFYTVNNLILNPSLPRDLFPGIFVSGSSDAGMAAAQAIGATAIKYPQPVQTYEGNLTPEGVSTGIRIGVIARETEREAWSEAYRRFPADRRGQLTHQLAMKVSDSAWHKQLSQLGEEAESGLNPYWLVPFQNYKTFCPYLVGSYDRVAEEIARYINVGFRTFILDIPVSLEDLTHINIAFERAKLREKTTS